jgi:hypothetical protein
MSQCPYCGDTRLSFNPRPTRQFDEGDLFHCAGCGGEGESKDLIEPEPAIHVMGFDSVEEMIDHMRTSEDIANASVTPDQAEIGYGAYWMRVDQPVMIFGYVPTPEEQEASERALGADDDEIEYQREVFADAYRRGYRYGKCHSAWEPDGEWGSTHISTMIQIQKHQYERAQAKGWDRESLMDPEGEDGRWIIGHMLRTGYLQPEQVGLKPWPGGKNPFLK